MSYFDEHQQQQRQQGQFYSESGYNEFGRFDYGDQEFNTTSSQMPSNAPFATPFPHNQPGAQPALFTPNFSTDPFSSGPNVDDPYADEPPLLEELGINFDHITQKTLAVLNPFRQTEALILQDSDLAGPLVFCLAFGSFLLLSGKVHFGYIYGFGALGCLSIYALLNMMSPPQTTLTLACTISVLGYCLLPIVLLSGVSILLALNGPLGSIAALVSVFWCAVSASKLFVIALTLQNQQALVAYPCALLYGVFALLTVF